MRFGELGFSVMKTVHDHDARHHRQALVADRPERLAQAFEVLIEARGEAFQMRLLPFVAGHAVGLVIDRDHDLRHGGVSKGLLAIEDRADRFHG